MEGTSHEPDKRSLWIPLQTRDKKTPLPPDFELQPYSVRIGRGKACAEATGNRRLRVLVSSFLDDYRKASSRIEKSIIVSKIVDSIHEACPVGAFVKYQGGKWWEVDDFTAREKVGSLIRDLLSDQYRSSSKVKNARRKKQKRNSLTTDTANVVRSNMDPRSSDLLHMVATKKPPPQYHTFSEQGDNAAWSSESQGMSDEGLLSPTHTSSTKPQTSRQECHRQDVLPTGTTSVVDSILDLRSSDLPFSSHDNQEKMMATKKPPPLHKKIAEQADIMARPNESQRLNDGKRVTLPAPNATGSVPACHVSVSVKTMSTMAKSQEPQYSSTGKEDFHDVDIIGGLEDFPW
eukprot:scaffold3670_cov124-Cylindrotheca_fusiformis.AAC.34